MPIRYSSIVGGGGTSGFNLNIGSSGNTTFYFDEPQLAGGYSITSQLADSTIEFYAIAEDGTLAGYTNTKALTTTKDFDTIVVYGATNNDLITFEFKETIDPTASGDQDSGAAPFITSVSDADLANIDDTTIITGGNFATNVTVTFTGTDNVVRNAKSVVRTNSTQLIVTRPDAFLEDNAPYTLTVVNPGITQSAIITNTSSITAGGDPVWVTAAGALPGAVTLEAVDPDGGAITYSIVSGQLPNGLSLNSSTGQIFGSPTTPGENQSFVVAATDSSGNVTNRSFSLQIVLASGGEITNISGYRVHTFTSSGTFTANFSLANAQYMILAGGGGGGASESSTSAGDGGGGGGAGGIIVNSSSTISAGSYTVTVGAGGAHMVDGSNSSFNSLVAFGGGRGGSDAGVNNTEGDNGGNPGGSGGGAASTCAGLALGGAGTQGQGNNGGNAEGCSERHGAGGGGAGAVGSGGNLLGTGNGGVGIQNNYQTGSNIYYAGGGGGGAGGSGSGPAGAGGLGGGGNGGANPGTQNLGGGGGGTNAGSSSAGGSGGSGIVIIRYPV